MLLIRQEPSDKIWAGEDEQERIRKEDLLVETVGSFRTGHWGDVQESSWEDHRDEGKR